VVFDNGFEFSATHLQAPPLLTVSVPLGLQYGANPGRIVNQSANGDGLEVQPERTLALVGGEVALEGGNLFARNGRVELGSVAGNSRVSLTATNTGYALSYEGVEDFQDIRLLQNALVDAGGKEGGSIQVQGRNVTLTGGSALFLEGAGVGEGLSVNASESVQVIGRSADGLLGSAVFANSASDSTGDVGNLTITTKRLVIRDGALVSAITFGAGKEGNLTVNASESVQVIGRSLDGQFGSGLSTRAEGTSNAGNLTITTPALLIRDGAFVRASNFGAGKGGNLTINASEGVQVIGTSTDGQFGSDLSTRAEGTSNAGNLTITTPTLLIRDGAQVGSRTLGSGKGGNLTVNASQEVQVIGESADGRVDSKLSTDPVGTGDAGDLTITTSRLLISDGAQVSADTNGSGKGGNLTVNASQEVQVIGESADGRIGSNLSADTLGIGDAGGLSITTSRLLISDGAQVGAGTFGAGNGGNLTINASQEVQVIGESADGKGVSALSVQANGNATGDAGDLAITTGRLLISDGAQVSASTFGSGKGGILTVNASQEVQLIGRSADGQFPSALSAQANDNTTGDAGDLTITTGRLLISDGAQVSASTFGSGKGGILTVNASQEVQLIGRSADDRFPSALSVQTQGTGEAGDLTITTPRLFIFDGAQMSAGTFGAGKGGILTVNASQEVQLIGRSADGQFPSASSVQTQGTGEAGDLTITTGRLLISDGAKVSADTFGSGKGGILTVNASDEVQLTGAGGLFVNATAGGTAGNLSVQTRQMSVGDGAQVTVSSPSGQAGNMTITADSLTLNQGKLTAVTGTSGAEAGANIILQGLGFLRMDNESLISASALEDANGGNVTIDSTFIVATPPKGSEGSDITANAIRGNGGRVNITTQGLFGIDFRPKPTPNNDITASSEVGLDGEVAINQPDVDPSRGLAELPTDVVDATRQIDRRCTPAGAAQRSSFVVTGRGGLPPNPTDPLTGEAVIADWVTLDSEEENTNTAAPEANSTSTTPKQFVEAQGWVYGSDGQVILVAEAPTATPQSPWSTSPSCQGNSKVKS
jgi:large exoprotein involved in heme utilization and adhesion